MNIEDLDPNKLFRNIKGYLFGKESIPVFLVALKPDGCRIWERISTLNIVVEGLLVGWQHVRLANGVVCRTDNALEK